MTAGAMRTSSGRRSASGALRRDEVNSATSNDQYVQAEWLIGQWSLTGGLRHSNATYKVVDNYVTDGNQDDSGTIRYNNTTPCWRSSTV
jgi:iron complex outermembrane receptor protein